MEAKIRGGGIGDDRNSAEFARTVFPGWKWKIKFSRIVIAADVSRGFASVVVRPSIGFRRSVEFPGGTGQCERGSVNSDRWPRV